MNLNKFLAVIITTIVFPWLFYKNQIGLNLFIYNAIIIGGLYFVGKVNLKYLTSRIIFTGAIVTAILVPIYGSAFTIAINIISLVFLAGIALFPKSRNMVMVGLNSVVNLFYSQFSFFSLLNEVASGSKITRNVIRFIQIVLIPLVVVIIFMLIYRAANPVFEGFIKTFFDMLNTFYQSILEYFEITLILVTALGFILSNNFFLGKPIPEITDPEAKLSMDLKPKLVFETENSSANEVEYRSAVVLFSLLNILILIINVIDINWVWFNFDWNGQYLKQFVHEGTYLLILSIAISLAISIFYFRGRLNFLNNNKPLRILAYVWLFQNAILAISVGVRNYWYINYFSLAYLRIGVIFFLILTIYSIYTVYKKISKKKSTYYLFSVNSVAAYVVLVVMALFNWDVIIARYNFAHSNSAFLHYQFLSSLSNKALPYLDKSQQELDKIDLEQEQVFSFEGEFMSSGEFKEKIDRRKEEFLMNWPEKNWQEWTYSNHRAYVDLKE